MILLFIISRLKNGRAEIINKPFSYFPNPRRRHSAVFLENQMVMFGGFDGKFYNDMHYAVFEKFTHTENFENLINSFPQSLNPFIQRDIKGNKFDSYYYIEI